MNPLHFFKAATENRGADAILENLANVNLASDLSLVADNGRIAASSDSKLPLEYPDFFLF